MPKMYYHTAQKSWRALKYAASNIVNAYTLWRVWEMGRDEELEQIRREEHTCVAGCTKENKGNAGHSICLSEKVLVSRLKYQSHALHGNADFAPNQVFLGDLSTQRFPVLEASSASVHLRYRSRLSVNWGLKMNHVRTLRSQPQIGWEFVGLSRFRKACHAMQFVSRKAKVDVLVGNPKFKHVQLPKEQKRKN